MPAVVSQVMNELPGGCESLLPIMTESIGSQMVPPSVLKACINSGDVLAVSAQFGHGIVKIMPDQFGLTCEPSMLSIVSVRFWAKAISQHILLITMKRIVIDGTNLLIFAVIPYHLELINTFRAVVMSESSWQAVD